MNHEEKAAEIFSNNYNCAQAVFAAFADELNLSEEDCARVASAFGAGISRTQQVCGAVTGALMVIGASTFSKDNIVESKGLSYSKGESFMEAFEKETGSINCKDILGCNLQEAGEKGLFNTTCVSAVSLAARLIVKDFLD